MGNTRKSRLVSARRLLETSFDKKSRPSLRFLRKLQQKGVISYYKVGRLVVFDPEEVREALAANCRVAAAVSVAAHPPRLGSARVIGLTSSNIDSASK